LAGKGMKENAKVDSISYKEHGTYSPYKVKKRGLENEGTD
jgi:hypothetical protein